MLKGFRIRTGTTDVAGAKRFRGTSDKEQKKRFRKDRHKAKKVAVFRYAYYAPAFKYFAEQVLDCDYLPLPNATRRTMELGIQNSADDVCAPFKHMMGDWMEQMCSCKWEGLAVSASMGRCRRRYCARSATTSPC